MISNYYAKSRMYFTLRKITNQQSGILREIKNVFYCAQNYESTTKKYFITQHRESRILRKIKNLFY